MNTTKNIRTLLFGVGAVFALFGTAPAYADVTSGSAEASALEANVLPPLVVVGPVPQSSVTGDDSDSDSVVSVNVPGVLNTGILNSSASSNVDGSPGPKNATARSSVVDFNLLTPTFGLSFELIESESSVFGDAGSFSATGDSNIVDLRGSGLLEGLSASALNGSPNQELFNAGGIQVIANRQSSTCGAESCSITTDALFVDAGDITSITVASSSAELMGQTAPIPEPSTYAMMLVGLVGIGAMRKFRNRSA
jgi:hypothetical protein